jgi:D-alanyl-D-alanine carboxypeptidase/D-alanyl-D-alanine-endopeptidase (penicillin-binding protein 4)
MRHGTGTFHRPNGPSSAFARRILVAAACCLLAVVPPALAGSEGPLARKLQRALQVPQVIPSRSAAIAVDLKTRAVVFQEHRSLSLAPASNEKLTVTYGALTTLGAAFRFRTEVVGDGGQTGRVWKGDLVLKGYGDPTLSSDDLKSLARQVRSAGIKRVAGRVLGDESFFDAKRGVNGWKSYYYSEESPPLSALTVDRATYRGHQVSRPAAAAATAFRRALLGAGVSVRGSAGEGHVTEPAVKLAIVRSQPLLKIMRFMDRESDNFTAELLLKQLGVLAGKGTSARGAIMVRRTLAEAGVPLQGVRLVDGSGLSTLDRLTARALVGILQAAWDDKSLRRPFFSLLAVSGRNGTLKKRLQTPPALGHIHAKTGTTDEASSLSGYVKGRYAFAVLHNGSPLATWWAKQAEDRFVTVLARAK